MECSYRVSGGAAERADERVVERDERGGDGQPAQRRQNVWSVVTVSVVARPLVVRQRRGVVSERDERGGDGQPAQRRQNVWSVVTVSVVARPLVVRQRRGVVSERDERGGDGQPAQRRQNVWSVVTVSVVARPLVVRQRRAPARGGQPAQRRGAACRAAPSGTAARPPRHGSSATGAGTPAPAQPYSLVGKDLYQSVRILLSSYGKSSKSTQPDGEVDELLAMQRTNFRALSRLIKSIKVENISDKWELEDELNGVQSIWKIIDAQHLKIDHILAGGDISYDEEFTRHELAYKISNVS
ncbi:hypothetical protein HF086_017204 [Spodoptera exigua]|uniref:Uncharacterized protein n=1 Tax=Spodoptera exigua TaxID=7107 RepID=A0A922MEF4_SPOEX|nr:hypothetical protein HF086_017204 [Spodoptera exigua]